jgi:hypothetical protein
MKKRILLFTLVAGIGALTTSSWITGVANTAGYDCTGAETGLGNPTGCAAPGSSCHSTTATSGILVAIELDSAGIAVSHYTGGHSYTIKVTGTNNSTATDLSKYGLQVAVITGSVAVTTPTNAGTFGTPPTGTRYTPASPGSYVVNVIENRTQMTPATGTGGTGTTYVTLIPWTAPAAGTGTISIWTSLNAVNNNNLQDAGDLWNTSHLAVPEPAPTAVANVVNNVSVKAFPNPVVNNLQLQIEDATEGTYDLRVFSLNGKMVATEQINVSGSTSTTAINTSAWASGLYTLVLTNENSSKVITVVKQ